MLMDALSYCVNDSYMASPPTGEWNRLGPIWCSLTRADGTLCQWYACPAVNAVPVPETIAWEQSGSIQPLAIAVQVGRRARLRAHQTVAVFGCGPLGLLCMAVAKAYGARKILAVDISESRLKFAKSYAATHTFSPPRRGQDDEIMSWNRQVAADVLKEIGEEAGVDVVIEASGAEPCMQLGVHLLRTGGTCERRLLSPLLLLPSYRPPTPTPHPPTVRVSPDPR
jgi:D-xylulose reductase